MIIGIVGKVGSGKTACTEYLKKKYNAIVFSCDKIAKEIIDNRETDYIPLPSGIFFRNEIAQMECRKIIHPLVFDKIKKHINNLENDVKTNDEKTETLIVIECALPNDTLYEICDKIICITNSYEDKLKLLNETRGYSNEAVKLIYDSQKYYDKYYNKSDYFIINNGSVIDLENKLKEVIDEIYFIRK
ncbi:MAG: dephospho-CoA kinase [Lachnospiraceae bacterium]|nr:dephospho-CoA kinase [Lachnospiraceae bacterium]